MILVTAFVIYKLINTIRDIFFMHRYGAFYTSSFYVILACLSQSMSCEEVLLYLKGQNWRQEIAQTLNEQFGRCI